MTQPVTLGELKGAGDLDFGDGYRTRADQLASEGFRILRAADVLDRAVSLTGPDFVGVEHASAIGSKRAQAGDVVLTSKGTVGRVAMMPALNEPVVYSPQLCYFRPRVGGRLEAAYLQHWFHGAEFAAQAGFLMHNTDMAPYISLRDFSSMRISLPPLPTQQAIAEVLGALDDKIAANEAPNGSVERLLRAHLARLSDLPSAGPREISELIDFNPRCSAPLDPITFVDMNKLPTADSVIRDWGSRPAVAGGARFVNGDTLLARITPCLENRKTGFVDFLEAGEVGVGSTEFVVMRSRRGIAKPVSYLLATDEGFRTHAALHMTGTSGRQRVAAADLAKYEMLLPPDEGFRELGELATALFTRLARARDENRTLAALRDTLLPELMAGRLRVKDAEHRVEEAL